MLETLAKLQNIDRRVIYLAVALACTLPFLVTIPLPVYQTAETRALYEFIQRCPPDKVVLIDSQMDPGSVSETWGQLHGVVEHLFRKGIPFVVTSVDEPFAPPLVNKVISELTTDHWEAGRWVKAKFPHKNYGKDWVNLGFTKGAWQARQQIGKDIRKQYKTDIRGYRLDDAVHLPLMQRVHNIDDIYLVFNIAYQPNEEWISFIHGVYGTPIAFGCSGINSTTYYRYLSSKQLVGMLVSVRGGAEYDAILNPRAAWRQNLGSRLIVPLAFGHLVFIAAVVLGNMGYLASRRKGR